MAIPISQLKRNTIRPVQGPERTIESIGRLGELKKTIEDPIVFYTEYAKELTENAKATRARIITIDVNEKLEPGCNE